MWNTLLERLSPDEQNTSLLFNIPYEATDQQYDATRIVPDRGYIRIWVASMNVSQTRNWFVESYPAVHTEVSVEFGDRKVGFTHITEANAEVFQNVHGVAVNYPVTNLLPYRGGTIEIHSVLLALHGASDMLGMGLSLLKGFNNVATRVPLGAAVEIASAVALGVQEIVNIGDGTPHLYLHQTLDSGGGLSPGPIGEGIDADSSDSGGGLSPGINPGYQLIMNTNGEDIDTDHLRVQNHQLYYHNELVSDYDYMLLRIEGCSHRSGWAGFDHINRPMQKAFEAIFDPEATDETKRLLRHAVGMAVVRSNELTRSDQKRVFLEIMDELNDWQARVDEHQLTREDLEQLSLRTVMEGEEVTELESHNILTYRDIFAS